VNAQWLRQNRASVVAQQLGRKLGGRKPSPLVAHSFARSR
jgi:hypothetical protein